MSDNRELTERYNALKAAMHAILDESTKEGAPPKASLTRIQKIAARAVIDTFAAKLQLVPENHRVVPVEPIRKQIVAALGKSYGAEDELLLRGDYSKMVLAMPQDDIGDLNE